MLQQNIKPILNTRKPLRQSLKELHNQSMELPGKAALLPFAMDSLQIKSEDFEDWYRRAWWGYYASILVRKYLMTNQGREVMDLVEPNDWQPLETALKSGKGAMLVTAHMGLAPLVRYYSSHTEYKILKIHSYSSAIKRPTQDLTTNTQKGRQTSLLQSMSHLRGGGVILCAPDGRFGENYILADLLGQEVTIFHGLAELARISRAPTLWLSAGWTENDSIQLNLEPFGSGTDVKSEDWTTKWYIAYLNILAREMRCCPANLGFINGIWRTRRGGIDWYKGAEEIGYDPGKIPDIFPKNKMVRIMLKILYKLKFYAREYFHRHR